MSAQAASGPNKEGSIIPVFAFIAVVFTFNYGYIHFPHISKQIN